MKTTEIKIKVHGKDGPCDELALHRWAREVIEAGIAFQGKAY